MILGIEIVNFDVFDNDKAGILIDDFIGAKENAGKLNALRGLNALIGRNSTGKTSFMGCMAFLKDTITQGCAQASISYGRPGFANMTPDITKPSIFRVFFKLEDKKEGKPKYIQYELAIVTSRFKSPIIDSEKVILAAPGEDGMKAVTILDMNGGNGVIRKINGETIESDIGVEDEHLAALSLYGKISGYRDFVMLYKEISQWFFCSFSSEEQSSYYYEGGAPGGHKHLNSTGSNVGNVLEYIKMENEEEYERIVNEIKEKIPTMKRKKNLPLALKESPDKLFLYLLLLRDSKPRSTIFIETPDKDLYHDMVDVLSDEMREYTMKNHYCQIMFSTHNPYIIETLSPKEIWIFERSFEKDDGDVSIRCAGEDPLVMEMFHQGVGMGAIWYGGHLDTRPEDD
ncbi:MAG: ATP-binding protein [Clostridiales bacterium]|jgi:predicted ATPase|nr:ATP-binding protein [Clostridiales bacterium]